MVSTRPLAPCLLVLLFIAAACGPEGRGSEDPPAVATRSDVVFTIAEPDLLPENVAYDPSTGSYFVGSTRKGKILRVLNGAVTEFKGPREDGLWMVIGMKVDAARRSLWVCTSQGGNLENAAFTGGRTAALLRFNVDSGELLDRWVLDAAGENHFLNDLVLDAEGRAYVTHMFDEASLWRAEPDGDFERFLSLPAGFFPNGITRSGDGSALYVAGASGILRVEVEGREAVAVMAPDDGTTLGIDGLYGIEGALVGVRPDGPGVWLYRLDQSGTSIESSTAILVDHPLFFGPTTGVIVGNSLHFVANAQFDRVGEDGSLPPLADLSDPVVLSVALPGGERP